MKKLTRSTSISINSNICFVIMVDNVIILPQDGAFHYELNPVASNIFLLAEKEPTNLVEIEAYIENNYQLDGATAMNDTVQFIEKMVEQNFLTLS